MLSISHTLPNHDPRRPFTLGEEIITGEVLKEARAPLGNENRGPGRRYEGVDVGRIMYSTEKAKGRVGYTVSDQVDAALIFRHGDTVSFHLATGRRDGRQTAKNVTLVAKAQVDEVDGIIRSLKDGFGFIERADVASEIFFHFTEFDPAQQRTLGTGRRHRRV